MEYTDMRRKIAGGKAKNTSRGQVIQGLEGHVKNCSPQNKSDEKPLKGFKKRGGVCVCQNKTKQNTTNNKKYLSFDKTTVLIWQRLTQKSAEQV